MPQRRRGTNKISSLCLLCLFVAGFAGCQRELNVDIKIAHEVAPQPPRIGQATITLRVSDSSGAPVKGARIKLEGNMSHAGMAPVFAEAVEVEPGRYRANMELTMAGDWVVLVHGSLAGDRKLEQQFELTVHNAEDVR